MDQQRDEDAHQAELERQRVDEERRADTRIQALGWREEYEAQGGRLIPISEFEQRHERARLFEIAEHRFPVRACQDCDFGFVFQCRVPVANEEELKHVKVQVHNDILGAGIRQLVGEIVVFPTSEIFQALQAGVIDCYSAAVRL